MLMQSEKEKMIAGALYRASDPELVADRMTARKLQKAYNDSSPDELEKRKAILRDLLGHCPAAIEIEPPFRCDYGYNIRVGDSFYANFDCVVLDCAPVTIGSNVFFGPKVQIYTATHPLLPSERNFGLEAAAPIVIGDSVWIGGGVIVNPGVTIGEGTTIGAGSVVTRDIPPRVFAAGNPCRVIRQCDDQCPPR